jgi:mono/diheme cytochrome c family protein
MRLGIFASCLVALSYGRQAHAEYLTYTRDIKPLLDAHCVECHHDGGRHPDLSVFPFRAEGSGDTGEQIVQKILEKVDTAAPKMPPGVRKKLSRDEVARIRTWLEQGLNP